MSNTNYSDFTQFLPSPLQEHTRRAIANATTRAVDLDPSPDLDPPTAEQFETLDVVDALGRLIDRVGAPRLQQLLVFVAAARGENL